MRISIALAQSLLLGSTFVVIPGISFFIGFGATKPLVLSAFVAALWADAFTTKIGLQHGLREFNPMFHIVRKWVSTNQFIVFSTIFGIGIGILAMIALPSIVLIGFTTLAMVGVLGNTFLISRKVVVPKKELH